MISPVSGYNPSTYGIYGSYYANRAAQTLGAYRAAQSQPAQRPDVVMTARKATQPETPVQPVTPTRAISTEDPAKAGLLRFGSDPVEMAVRQRIQYPGDSAQPAEEPDVPGLPTGKTADAQFSIPGLPNSKDAEAYLLVLILHRRFSATYLRHPTQMF